MNRCCLPGIMANANKELGNEYKSENSKYKQRQWISMVSQEMKFAYHYNLYHILLLGLENLLI